MGLKRRGNLSLNLRGVGDATGVSVGVGLGDTAAVVFVRIRLGVADAAGAVSAAAGEALLSTTGVASAVFFGRCFGGEEDSVGVSVSSCD